MACDAGRGAGRSGEEGAAPSDAAECAEGAERVAGETSAGDRAMRRAGSNVSAPRATIPSVVSTAMVGFI